jgi:hypothetical protein
MLGIQYRVHATGKISPEQRSTRQKIPPGRRRESIC